MLEDRPQIAINEIVFRIYNPIRTSIALRAAGADLEVTSETTEFLREDRANELSEYLAKFFMENVGGYKPSSTRFSDGTYRVFYSALERETAQEEVAYWLSQEVKSDPPAARRWHYRETSWQLVANGYDLRPLGWPFLTGDRSSYPQCQAIAVEAKAANATAMLCPSARRAGGTTSPAFIANVLSGGAIIGNAIFDIDARGVVTIAAGAV